MPILAIKHFIINKYKISIDISHQRDNTDKLQNTWIVLPYEFLRKEGTYNPIFTNLYIFPFYYADMCVTTYTRVRDINHGKYVFYCN